MISLDSILIQELKSQDIDSNINELATTKLYTNFTTSIYLINEHLKNMNGSNFTKIQFRIGHLIQLSLIKCHVVIQDLEQRKKEKIQRLASIILNRLYHEILLNLPIEKRAYFVENVEQLWDESAFIFNLSHYRINKFWLSPEKNQAPLNLKLQSFTNFQKLPGLVWNCKSDGSFQKFLEILDEFEIGNPENFAELFERPKHKLALQLNKSDPDFVLQFLCCLKESKLISYYNTKGFYQVFQAHIADFKPVFLKNKKPQRRVDAVKNLISWLPNQEEINNAFKRIL